MKRRSLKGYDHLRHGPFLGVSDEGSAVESILRAARSSPKAIALETDDPLVLGMALDAERLGAVGEVAVGPEEYRRIRRAARHRLLTTTNVGTRVNVRHYKNRPVVVVKPGTPSRAIADAVRQVLGIVARFRDTPDGRPRPITILLMPVGSSTTEWRAEVLRGIIRRADGKAPRPPCLHSFALHGKVAAGEVGAKDVTALIDLASKCGIAEVTVEGVQRVFAERVISMPGLLNYFAPSILSPILRYAATHGVSVNARKVVDAETTARNIWSGLFAAKHMGLALGKYGLAPLTFSEQETVIRRVQGWFAGWSAAPVHYVDMPGLSSTEVYGTRNAVAGASRWLGMVAGCGVPVVLIDTAEKSKGVRLLKRGAADAKGVFDLGQVAELDSQATRMGLKVLWAGGLDAGQACSLGELGVFGLYVTSAAAEEIAATDDYADDPMLYALKEPSFEKVLLVKTLIEAGFLSKRLAESGRAAEAARIRRAADGLLISLAKGKPEARKEKTLRRRLVKCWRML